MAGKTSVITVRHLSKDYRFAKRQGLRGLFVPDYHTVAAVDDVSFRIKRGESVAFIGPNGAGKSTTIKMLCGILRPTKGQVKVLGLDPLRQRRQLAYRIGTVFGQRSQLIFNLPLIDTFRLTAEMYAIEKRVADDRIAAAIEQFDLAAFIDRPVRKLSLGQRMRAEIANSLLHKPDIIFLDEPTIGLDVVAKRTLRQIISKTNKEQGTTIFLTSHDAGDIEEVADRTIVVNHGHIVWDASTQQLRRDYFHRKVIRVTPKKKRVPTILGVVAVRDEMGTAHFSIDTTIHTAKEFLEALLAKVEVEDITIEDTSLEDIIHEMYVRQAA